MNLYSLADFKVFCIFQISGGFTDQLIERGFTIFEAVHNFYKGTLTSYMNNVVQVDNTVDTELFKKMVGVWINNMVKRRKVLGPPLSARMRDMLQKKAYILIRSYSIVPKEVSDKVQFNRLFPDAVEQDAVKIIHEKAKDIKVEVDQEMMNFLNIDDKNWLPNMSSQSRSGEEGNEPFVDYPGNVMILEKVKISGKNKASVSATLCGIPRIKPLVHMDVWSNEQLESNHCCKVVVDDRRLIRGNRIMLYIINTSDEDVVLPPRYVVRFHRWYNNIKVLFSLCLL